MHLTIERLRTLVLVAGGLLVIALVAFLALGRWKSRLSLHDLPKRLGANIERQANGFVYTQSHNGHTLFKIHATKVVQLKENGRALLDDVEIELYGKDGETVDRIRGGEFQWDAKARTATAAGPVEILIMRPTATPAVAEGKHGSKPKVAPPKPVGAPSPLSNAAQQVAAGQIDVKTSGLTFDQQTGTATTAQRVEFVTAQGSGSSEGATFESDNGQLVLDRKVELNVRRGSENVLIRAQHAEFERYALACDLREATAAYRGGEAKAGQALILFRENGSAVRLNASNGFSLTTATGARIAAPTGSLDFNQQNQPQQGRLEGGVTMASQAEGREANGSAETAELAFSPQGELRHAHLSGSGGRGVMLHSEQDEPGQTHVVRDWNSPVADVDFRTKDGRTEIDKVHGTGGVIIRGASQRAGGPEAPSRMTAEDVTGVFGAEQQLSELIGAGHANLEQTTAAGARQVTSGDRIDAHFVPASATGTGRQQGSLQIQVAAIDGHVSLMQQEPAKAGQAAPAPLRATAEHALYQGTGEWLHLTENPRIEDGGLELTANRVDVSQASGDAFAHGNVKATWIESGKQASEQTGTAAGGIGLGGDEPVHVIAAEAQMRKTTGEATFRGDARLWQGANSISAPSIVLNRTRQTLTARGSGTAQPVNVVMLSANGPEGKPKSAGKPATPAVVRVRAGDLKYSSAERKAVLKAEGAGSVLAQTEGATVSSSEVELILLPPGNHAGPEGRAAQVDRMTARGHVVVSSEGRRGIGEKLVYTSDSGEYVLTGTSAAPPRMTDPAHGTVSGNALIFNTRDDSVSIEGQGQKTSTQTVAPR